MRQSAVTDDQRIDSELQEFFDLSDDLLCICGLDGSFRRVNAGLVRALGYPRDELFRRSVFDLTHPDDRGRARYALERGAEGQNLIGFEARVVRDRTERRRTDAVLGEARCELHALAGEQEALRLVAQEKPEAEVFGAIAEEIARLADEQAALRRVATLVAEGGTVLIAHLPL